jgi:hypothetical protein
MMWKWNESLLRRWIVLDRDDWLARFRSRRKCWHYETASKRGAEETKIVKLENIFSMQ